MKIAFIIPFFYNWNNYSNVRANYEYLQILGHEVDIFSKKENKKINFDNYDLVMLHGSGAILTSEEIGKCKKPIFCFGWSDPNLFNITHYSQSNIYFTSDLRLSKILTDNVVYYRISCDKRYHKNLNLEKTTNVLVYGVGNHKFVTDRNDNVDKLRKLGFKIRVFGRGWNVHPDTYGFIEGQELVEEINKAHIMLDLSNKTTAIPRRILEASACATPVITINREDTRLMFIDDEEIILYKSTQDMFDKVEYFLQHKEELKHIGNKAQIRCYKDHDISVRIKELDKYLENIK